MLSRTLFSRVATPLTRSLYHLHLPISRPHKLPTSHFSSSSISSPSSFSDIPFLASLSSPTLQSSPISFSDDINEISRILSDFRNPHDDIESALKPFSTKISTDLVEQVLKRCKNLGTSAHRFFLWAGKLPRFLHSRETYHILIDILGSSKNFPMIWDMLSEMRDNGDCEITPEIFWNIFRSYSRADLPMDAVRAFDKMSDFGIKPSVDDLDHLLYVLCKKKQVKHAQEFYDRVKFDFPPSAKTYSILMRGWGDLGESHEAQKLFDEILQRGCSIDLVAYNTLMECLCKGGKGDEAYKLLREMGLYGLKPDERSYSIFITAYCEANDVRSAMRVLDRMRRYDLTPNVFTYNTIIKTFVKQRMIDDTYPLLDEMVERGVSPDVWCYNAILAYHCNHSEVNQALKLFSRMEEYCCLPDRHTYNMLLKMLIRVGRFDRATELWESMGQSGFNPSVSTFSVMVHGFAKKKGKLEDACKYFETMIDEGLPPYSCTCEMLRTRLLQLGLREKTEILAEKMLQSTSCSIQGLSTIMTGEKASREWGEKVSRESIVEEEKPIWYKDHE